MRTIWKFALPTATVDFFDIDMPRGAVILRLAPQGGVPHLWAEVDSEAEEAERRSFQIVGTGGPVPTACAKAYLGSWEQGPFVWHLYELLA